MFRKCGMSLMLLLVSLTLSGFASPAAEAAGGGNPWWIWILVLLALALFAAVVVWWWMRGTGKEEDAGRVAPAGVRETKPPPAHAPDDLKRIEGIGPKISSILHAAGITTFAKLEATPVERLREILEAANPNLLRLADPATWPEQARLAAAGDWGALEALQDELKGGRRT